MTLNHFTLNFHCYEQLVLFTYLLQSMFRHVTSGSMCGCAEVDRDPQNIWNPQKNRIFRRRYIVGILRNKANICIVFSIYLVPYRLSTDSKTCDLKWSFCVKFCFARYVWSSETWLSKLGYF